MKRSLLVLLCVLCSHNMVVQAGENLAKNFASPPDSARMWTWWFWLGDKVDAASITKDLEALRAQGVAGVTVYSLSGPGVPGKGPNYMSPEWRELWKHTLNEANRLNLGVSTMLCSGWNAGGPWIKPEQACKQHVSAEIILDGPRHFKEQLPMPAGDPRFYQDVAVQAIPLPSDRAMPSLSASSSHANYPVANAADGKGESFWVSNGEKPNEGPSANKPEWLRIDLGESRIVKRLGITPRPGYGPRDAELQTSADGTAFATAKTLVMERDRSTEIQVPDQPVRFIRLFITSSYSPKQENVQVCEVTVDGKNLVPGPAALVPAYKTLNASFGDPSGTPIREVCDAPLKPLPPVDRSDAIDPAKIIDLTNKCDPHGVLEWDVPAGRWMVVRTGCGLTGKATNWSSPTGVGLEADPLDAAAMDFQFANVAAPLIEAAGPLAGKVFRSVQIDSWETELPNWSVGFLDGFRKSRGYDARPYLPVLAGHVVADAGTSDRFLYDYRKTVGEGLTANYFGRLSQLAEAKGIVQQSEAGGVCTPKVMAMDALANLGRCAIPMGEFWQDGTWVEANQNKNGKQTASAAHLYGKRIAAAEAFTSFVHWVDSPGSLKPTADRAFCEGFNHFFIFSSATRSEDGVPGTEFCAGTHFNRKITWWNQARCFSDYVARCSYLLQQGLFAADVLFYNGDGCPNFVSPKHLEPSLGPGYDYDACNSEIILTRLAVNNGRIVLPDGMTYRVMVLPERNDMPLEVLTKLKELVAAGMTLIGPRPERDPGLYDYPRRDQQVAAMAAELWGECDGKKVQEHAFGKGRVVWGTSVREVLARDGVKPDFSLSGTRPDTFLDWIHRTDKGAEIYFIANRNDRDEQATCTFRVAGRQPELWNPVTGEMRDLPGFKQTADGCTEVPLEFAPHQSWFVVFRNAATPQPIDGNFPAVKPLEAIAGPWQVQFDPQWIYPAAALSAEQRTGAFVFDALDDWSKRPEEGIKYYSGTAVYRKSFDFAKSATTPGDKGAEKRMFLDLGVVKDIARVKLNGRDLGVVWCHPWRVEITEALRIGENRLEIEVTNLWPNRLTGDSKLPAEQRRTQTNIGVNAVLPSGLLGPVVLKAAE
ncbi:MAG: glycosyl hydrolase [Verrucomicrobia bacterium]|nr:glycosyl hydrolase [Verrucomicrobiota bacterium]